LTATLACFKAYDIRGRIPDEINEDIVGRIGSAYAAYAHPDSVVVGYDVRPSGPALARALARSLTEAGADVLDIGLCGTEEVYFATRHLGAGGGIMVTASHNPADYNGLKLVREDARPVSGDSGLDEIRRRAEAGGTATAAAGGRQGRLRKTDVREAYVRHLLGYVDPSRLKALRLVVNAGNGSAGPVIDRIESELPFRMIKIHHEPDGDFPNGVPNPLLPENRFATSEAVRASQADFGVAWDGDFDRCFFFDECGEFIEGYYVVGLLAEAMLARVPGGRIIHDPRLVWNTRDIVRGRGGIAVQSKTGHAFIKERMRIEDAIYGGEMSAHHYFRDFGYCDSGMIPWLLVAALVSEAGKPLSALVADRVERFPCSGEINRRLSDPAAAMARVEERYRASALAVERIDGMSMEFAAWRFNLRMSNTEPVVRLNVETRADRRLLAERTRDILALLGDR
jgi:phosphomannomutase